MDRMQKASPLRGAEYPFVAGDAVANPSEEARGGDGADSAFPSAFTDASRDMARLQSRNSAVRQKAEVDAANMYAADKADL